jgi:hypothetical protein
MVDGERALSGHTIAEQLLIAAADRRLPPWQTHPGQGAYRQQSAHPGLPAYGAMNVPRPGSVTVLQLRLL